MGFRAAVLRSALGLALTVVAVSAGAQGIDLTMTSLTGATATVGLGKTFSVSSTVKTTGSVSKTFTVPRDATPTPTGKWKLGSWQRDKVSARWGEDSSRKWSEDALGRNVFGPWFVPVVGTDGIGIHGHYGPRITDVFMMHKVVSWCSHGCVRLSNYNIQELHDMLPNPEGTPVEIVGNCD